VRAELLLQLGDAVEEMGAKSLPESALRVWPFIIMIDDPNDPFAVFFKPGAPAPKPSSPVPSPVPPAGAAGGIKMPPAIPAQAIKGATPAAIPSISNAGPPPPPNKSIETGLDDFFIQELILKCVNLEGTPRGIDIAHSLRLNYNCLDQALEFLQQQQYLQVIRGGENFGRQTMQYSLTEKGSVRVSDILRRDNYIGPAPIPVSQWFEMIEAQSIENAHVSPEKVTKAFSRLVLDPTVVERIGPAINSARSMFLYGPPGNGKTSLAECITATIGGEVYIPHAVLVNRQIVRVFDALYHKEIMLSEAERQKTDARFVRCQRPVVMVGGELTLETLDLVRTAEATYYEAPFQVKATNGVLFIDDFGRQKCDPQELLNRWIVPLESRFDFLTFAGGQKMRVPFDALLVFSTNLDPKQLVDDAFLRRIRYKILVDNPTEENYRKIWWILCRLKNVQCDPEVLEHLIEKHYRGRRPFRACQPRDLLEQFLDISRFVGQTPKLTPEMIDRLCALYFVEM